MSEPPSSPPSVEPHDKEKADKSETSQVASNSPSPAAPVRSVKGQSQSVVFTKVPHFAVKCQLCKEASAVVTCEHCGDISTCLPCGQKRHRHGTLRHHSFKFIFSEPPHAAKIGDPCQWCERSRSTIRCPLCAMVFCEPCANQFHNEGTSTFNFHEQRYQYQHISGIRGSASRPSELNKKNWNYVLQRKKSQSSLRALSPPLSPTSPAGPVPPLPIPAGYAAKAAAAASSSRRPAAPKAVPKAAVGQSVPASVPSTSSPSPVPHDVEPSQNETTTTAPEHPLHSDPEHTDREVSESAPSSARQAALSSASSAAAAATTPPPDPAASAPSTSPGPPHALDSVTFHTNGLPAHPPLSVPSAGPGSLSVSVSLAGSQLPSGHSTLTEPLSPGFALANKRIAEAEAAAGHKPSNSLDAGSPPPRSNPSHPPLSGSNPAITFKLLAYGLGISDTKLYEMARTTSMKHYICIDNLKQSISIFGRKENNSLTTSHTRSFRSIKSVVLDEKDKQHFSIYFNDSAPAAQCLAMNRDEGVQLRDTLMTIARRERASILLQASVSDSLYSGYAQKKGKVSWSQRWLVLKRFKLEVYRGREAVAPINVILLDSGVGVEADNKKEKQFTLLCPDRSYTFRLESVAERDTLVSLLRKAGRPVSQAELRSIHAPRVPGAGLGVMPMPLGMTMHTRSATGSTGAPPLPAAAAAPPPAGSPVPTPQPLQPSLSPALSPASPGATATTSYSDALSLASAAPPGPLGLASADSEGNLSSAGSGRMPLSPSSSNQLIVSSSSQSLAALDRREVSRGFEQLLHKDFKFTPARLMSFSSIADKLAVGSANEGPQKSRIIFVEERPPELKSYARPPRVLRFGVYRLMDALCQSMQSGAQISPRIYMPKKVWFQQGAKFQAYKEKLDSFEYLQQELLHLKADDFNNVREFQESLFKFRMVAEEVQNRLSQHLSFVHSIKAPVSAADAKKEKSFWGTLKKRVKRGVSGAAKDKVGDTTKYVRLLMSILQQAALFEGWIKRLEGPSAPTDWASKDRATVNDHLIWISEFFHAVVCGVVMRDMLKVLKRYMKHCTRSIADSEEASIPNLAITK